MRSRGVGGVGAGRPPPTPAAACACAARRRRAAQAPGAASPTAASAPRSRSATAAGSAASRIARTTPSRRGARCDDLGDVAGVDAADREERVRRIRGRVLDQAEPDAGAPLFGRRLPDRADADVVDGAMPAGGESAPLECVERPMITSGPSSSRASATGMSSCPRWTPSALQRLREVGVVVDDEEGAVGVAEAAEGRRRRARSPPGPAPSRAAGRCRPRHSAPRAAALRGRRRRAAPRRRSRAARCAAARAAAGRGPPVAPGSSLDYGFERVRRRGSIE